jgi:hypothetical protein
MTTPQATAPPAKTVRLIHAAMIAGVLLFALVGHFLLKPALADSGDLPPIVPRALLGVSLGACALSLLLRRRVPHRSIDESADLFWTTATVPALLTWAPLEGASLLALFAYARTGALLAIPVAAVAILIFVLLNPAYLERPW